MEKAITLYETGYCFGGTQYYQFNNFEQAFKWACETKLNYIIRCKNDGVGNEHKTFICWDTIQILTYNQLAEKFNNSVEHQNFLSYQNKKGIFIFNNKDMPTHFSRAVMNYVFFNRIERFTDRQLENLKHTHNVVL